MSDSVKILLSYDYCHFEICLDTSESFDIRAVNEMRKTAQRLADEAVRQYKVAKEMTTKRERGKFEEERFLKIIEIIKQKPEGDRTVNDLAMLKQYLDENWREQFRYSYDYEDDQI